MVSNGVLLVEYGNELRRDGLGLHEAMTRAGRTPLRPIIMTSLNIGVGLIPIPTLYVMLEERFPRRVLATEGAPVLQGDMA